MTRAYRAALDAYAANPAEFDPAPYMDALNLLQTRGYTTAFFDGAVTADAHDYETTRSVSDYVAAGVITDVRDDAIVKLPRIINAATGADVPKLAAGQRNSIIIPRAWFGAAGHDMSRFAPYVLAYRHK